MSLDICIEWNYEDVSTPFEPFMGKEGCQDCNTLGPDGFPDLTLKFNTQAIVQTLGTTVNDRGLRETELDRDAQT
jgi:hypothetical protein